MWEFKEETLDAGDRRNLQIQWQKGEADERTGSKEHLMEKEWKAKDKRYKWGYKKKKKKYDCDCVALPL